MREERPALKLDLMRKDRPGLTASGVIGADVIADRDKLVES
jgi:hypothetical protein